MLYKCSIFNLSPTTDHLGCCSHLIPYQQFCDEHPADLCLLGHDLLYNTLLGTLAGFDLPFLQFMKFLSQQD